MKRKDLLQISFILLVCFSLAGCQQNSPEQSTAVSENFELTPYFTATQTPTATATPENLPTMTPTPQPTSTPQIVTLKSGDTLWTIAAKAGLTKEQILAANPDLNPYSLKVGMQVIVPAADTAAETTPSAPTPTPVGVVLGQPKCTPSLTGGLYCFAVVRNDLGFAVQSVDAQFVLSNSATNEMQVQPALLPLNHLQSGTELPLFAYFSPPVIADYTLQVHLFSALPEGSTDSTYVPLTVNLANTQISSDGYSATVSGTAAVQSQASEFWIAAVAYDADGNVVAVRQYSKKAELTAEAGADFKLYVYSIAGKIANVSIFGEASAQSN